MRRDAQQLWILTARDSIAGAVVGCSTDVLRQLGLWLAARKRAAAPAARI